MSTERTLPDASGGRSKADWTAWGAPFLFLALGFLTICGCVNAPFLQFDDRITVQQNPLLAADTGWLRLFSTRYYCQYVPVTLLSFKLNAALFGVDAAWSFRIVNWLVHSASGYVLFCVLRRLGTGSLGALFAACCWTAHPMACETVAWTTERSNVLAFFFGVSAFAAYLKWHRRPAGVALSAFLFLLALLSKPSALSWLPTWVAVEILGGPERFADDAAEAGLRPPRERWAAAARLSPFLVLGLTFALVGLFWAARVLRPPPGGSAWTALLTDSGIFLRYLGNIFCPLGLSGMYGVTEIVSLADLRLGLNVSAWLALLGGSLWLARSRRRAALGWLWFLGGLGPNANLVAIIFVMQDRYAYVASAGAWLVAVECLAGLERRLAAGKPASPRIASLSLVAGVLYVAGLGGLAAERSMLWGEFTAVLRQAIERQPNSALPRMFYAFTMDGKLERREQAGGAEAEQARAESAEIVRLLAEALAMPDAYRVHPLLPRVTLSRAALRADQPEQARQALEGFLPPAAEPPDPALPPELAGTGVRVMRTERYSFPVFYEPRLLAEGYACLAEADLDAFAAAAGRPEEARAQLTRALWNAEQSAIAWPKLLKAVLLEAQARLALEALEHDGQIEVARGRLRSARPFLERLAQVSEVRGDLAPPRPPGRAAALGALAMAHAAFALAQSPDVPPAACAQQCGNALSWVERAASADGSFGEAYWFGARVCHWMSEHEAKAGRADTAREQRARAQAFLQKIPEGSPRYGQARRNLAALGAP